MIQNTQKIFKEKKLNIFKITVKSQKQHRALIPSQLLLNLTTI
jgi:hypothetical protein